MEYNVKVWRQKNAKAKGHFETYHVTDVEEDASFLEMLDILNSSINNYVKGQIVDSGRLDAYVEKIRAHDTDPYTVVGGLLDEMLKK